MSVHLVRAPPISSTKRVCLASERLSASTTVSLALPQNIILRLPKHVFHVPMASSLPMEPLVLLLPLRFPLVPLWAEPLVGFLVLYYFAVVFVFVYLPSLSYSF